MAFFVVTLANQFALNSRLRWLSAAIILLAVYNILFMVGGRTGYLILFALICLLTFRRKGFRGLALAAGLMVCLGAVVYNCSSEFRERVNLAIQETADYYYYQRDSVESSVGRRLLFYRTSLLIARQNPVFGKGTGCFIVEFKKLPDNRGKIPTFNTHNEYFSVLVQTGLIGLSLFFYWLYTQWICSRQLPHEFVVLAQALLVTFIVGSVFNSMLSNHTEGWFYCYFLGMCYASVSQGTPGGEQESSSRSVLEE
jgi:O-antigen ligase